MVDEEALVDLLTTRRLGGAGLDVFANEPKVPEALFSLDNVVLQPHQASATRETRAAMETRVEESFDGVGPCPDDEDRLRPDHVLDEVADGSELFLAARDLPHARPQALHLEVAERGGGVALLRDGTVALHLERRGHHDPTLGPTAPG